MCVHNFGILSVRDHKKIQIRKSADNCIKTCIKFNIYSFLTICDKMKLKHFELNTIWKRVTENFMNSQDTDIRPPFALTKESSLREKLEPNPQRLWIQKYNFNDNAKEKKKKNNYRNH